MKQIEGDAEREQPDHPDPERDLVNSLSEDVHPRPERVLLDADQSVGRRARIRSDPPSTGPVGQA